MKNRTELLAEISRCEKAILKTNSPKLKKDYSKYIARLKKELKRYDNYKLEYAVNLLRK